MPPLRDIYSLKKSIQPKILLKIILLSVILSGLTLFTAHLFYSTPRSSSQSGSVPSVPVTASSTPLQQIVNSGLDGNNLVINQVGLPTRLKIPSIDIDAPFEYVGLTQDGAMDTPKNYDNVGWFNLGPRPGGNGSAVIAGHYGLINNKPSVFDNLHKLRKLDKIYIEDEKGRNIIFVVRKIQIYDKDDDSSGIFGSSDGRAHLNLITCTGVWNKAEKTFSERLVIFTDKES